MKKLIIGIGIPGSGKTTILKNFAVKNNYAYICPDDIRQEISGDVYDRSKNKEVWIEAKKRVAEKFSAKGGSLPAGRHGASGGNNGNAVVFDATFANPRERKEFLGYARENGAEKIEGIFVDIPVEIAKERNMKRERNVPEPDIDRMNMNIKKFPPEIADGFDALFTLDERGNLSKVEMIREGKIIKKEFGKIS